MDSDVFDTLEILLLEYQGVRDSLVEELQYSDIHKVTILNVLSDFGELNTRLDDLLKTKPENAP